MVKVCRANKHRSAPDRSISYLRGELNFFEERVKIRALWKKYGDPRVKKKAGRTKKSL